MTDLNRNEWRSPVSGELLQEVNLEGLHVHFDPVTSGYWLEAGELHTLAEHRGVNMSDVDTGATIERKGARICPQDGETTLVEFEFGDHSNIKLDICPKCQGIWLDTGELDRAIKYMEAIQFGVDKKALEEREDHMRITERIMLFFYALTARPPYY